MTGSTEPLDGELEVPDAEPPSSVTPELFRQWRSPRVGVANPERMNNPVWEWLVKAKLTAFQATGRLCGPNAMDAGPGWSFDRFGQSKTQLPDGRVVLIAGEHEDYYDPDFYIYNDVVVQHPEGHLDLFGYPREVFPPTDFHSATLVGDRIVIIGNLGYCHTRQPESTPVLCLDLATMAITPAETTGTSPGWIHKHTATLSEDRRSILLQRGKLDRGGAEASLVENLDDWRLHLPDWRWERLTQRQWPRWEVLRADRQRNHLWEIQQAQWSRRVGWKMEFDEQMRELTETLNVRPDLDLAAVLFRPTLVHEELPASEDEHSVHRIKVAGVVVRYVDDGRCIQITVEGDLPGPTLDALVADVSTKLSALENASTEVRRL